MILYHSSSMSRKDILQGHRTAILHNNMRCRFINDIGNKWGLRLQGLTEKITNGSGFRVWNG